ncbi:MAG: hypothetical protein R6V05_05700 [Candidatus Brocadiia bacterium]
MAKRCLVILLCLLAVAALTMSTGCGYFTPEKNARRLRVARADLERIPDEVDWALGLDAPSILYEDGLPPYRYAY